MELAFTRYAKTLNSLHQLYTSINQCSRYPGCETWRYHRSSSSKTKFLEKICQLKKLDINALTLVVNSKADRAHLPKRHCGWTLDQR